MLLTVSRLWVQGLWVGVSRTDMTFQGTYDHVKLPQVSEEIPAFMVAR